MPRASRKAAALLPASERQTTPVRHLPTRSEVVLSDSAGPGHRDARYPWKRPPVERGRERRLHDRLLRAHHVHGSQSRPRGVSPMRLT